MVSAFNGVTEQYLNGLERLQTRLETVNRQISSGTRVERPSDDPAAIGAIFDTTARIADSRQTATNLKQAQADMTATDTALQQAVKLMESAVSAGTQAASTLSASQTAALADQVRGIMQSMVGLANTQVNGRYIFSGDLDNQPLYAYDSATGVQQLATTGSTRAITDGQGATIWIPKTAGDIFDARDAGGAAAPGNVFSALNDLLLALEKQDPVAGSAAVDSLKQADDHLNQQLGLLGIAENRVTEALNAAQNGQSSLAARLSELRDTDVASAAIELNQVTLQQQAAMSAGAKMGQLSLFDYLR